MIFYRRDYTSLAILSILYILVIFRFQSTPRYIMLATIIFGVCYLVWGLVHHLRQHNFHARIVLEYLLVAILGLAIVSTLLL